MLPWANHSPKDSWENIIKEYNVTGPNVAHFNLPQEQQAAIERYLKVNSFPTYKLVDPQGNVLDMKVDARNLKSLEDVIKMLKGEKWRMNPMWNRSSIEFASTLHRISIDFASNLHRLCNGGSLEEQRRNIGGTMGVELCSARQWKCWDITKNIS